MNALGIDTYLYGYFAALAFCISWIAKFLGIIFDFHDSS